VDDLREGSRPERRLDPGAHGVEIDPDSGQRVPVQAAEQDRSSAWFVLVIAGAVLTWVSPPSGCSGSGGCRWWTCLVRSCRAVGRG
jgi:hypothetical protein